MKIIFIISLAILCSCTSIVGSRINDEDQKKTLDNLYKFDGLVTYTYDKDSVIIGAFQQFSGDNRGRYFEFHQNGNLKHVYIKNGEYKVGDESEFDESGIIREHYFWGTKQNLFFHILFEKGDVSLIEGEPWYIHRAPYAKVNEEFSIYVATPVIPTIVTNVIIQGETPKTKVSYINDLRQLVYKIIFKKEDVEMFKVNVSFERNKEVFYRDSVEFSVEIIR